MSKLADGSLLQTEKCIRLRARILLERTSIVLALTAKTGWDPLLPRTKFSKIWLSAMHWDPARV